MVNILGDRFDFGKVRLVWRGIYLVARGYGCVVI